MHNPFLETTTDAPTRSLVSSAQSGDREALNPSWPATSLGSSTSRSGMLLPPGRCGGRHSGHPHQGPQGSARIPGREPVRTWLYRIAVNHILNVKKDKWAASDAVCSFSAAAAGLAHTPDLDLPDARTIPVPIEILVAETKINCMVGRCCVSTAGSEWSSSWARFSA